MVSEVLVEDVGTVGWPLLALRYASEELRSDPKIVMAAVKKNGVCL
jgi:hypothetical protein